MKIQNLICAKFIRRYKRFFIDAELQNGETVVAHCPNTGSMKTLLDQTDEVWIRFDDNPKRKLKYTAEILKLQSGTLALVNTQRPNAIIEEALSSGQVDFLSDFKVWKREVKYGSENSKIDIWSQSGEQEVFVEVKNMTLMDQPGWGSFPDAVTTRGQKHLRELLEVAQTDNMQAVLCFLVSRDDVETFGIAGHIDSTYQTLYDEAVAGGVQVWAPTVIYEVSKMGQNENGDSLVDVEMTLGKALDQKKWI